MGGYGSGRVGWRTPRSTTESLLRLDVRRLHRYGQLQPGRRDSSSWLRNGKPSGSISHRAVGYGSRAKALVLEYRLTTNGQIEEVEQRVWLAWTPCNYGGARPWLLCPRCGRRVAILYAGHRFYCRRCHDLAYSSTRESVIDRGIYKAQAIRKRLGGSGDLTQPFPPKPKGMHWHTYYRLEDEARDAYHSALLGMANRLRLSIGRLER